MEKGEVITLPSNVKEYETLAAFIKKFRYMRCRVCGLEFKCLRRARPTRTCSTDCNKIWHNLKNAERQRRFRKKAK